MMKARYKIKGLLAAAFFVSVLCGWSLKEPTVTLDTKNRILYQSNSVEEISSDQEKDNNGYYMTVGKITEISKNGTSVILADENNNSKIKCSAGRDSVIAAIKDLKIGDVVKVYGKAKQKNPFQKEVGIDIAQITASDTETNINTKHSFLNGYACDKSVMKARELADGKVEYFIPEDWVGVEKDIVKNGLGSMEGYQYTLNEIAGELAAEPESVFVCYFDSKTKLKDRSRTDEKKGIRKAIIMNILPEIRKIKDSKVKKIKSYYGTEYYYYDDAYKDSQGQSHYVEFVFQEAEQEGMVVYLYVYKKENHLDEILSVMRFLTIEAAGGRMQ